MVTGERRAMRLRPSSDRKTGLVVKGTSLQLPLSYVVPWAMPTAASSFTNGSWCEDRHAS